MNEDKFTEKSSLASFILHKLEQKKLEHHKILRSQISAFSLQVEILNKQILDRIYSMEKKQDELIGMVKDAEANRQTNTKVDQTDEDDT